MSATRRHLAALGALLLAACPGSGHAVTVVSTESVLNRGFGVNLHLDNCCQGNYGDLPTIVKQLNYIGVRHVRDWADSDAQMTIWHQLRAATGLRFHASIPETSPAHQKASLDRIAAVLKSDPGLIEVIEGPNEEDNAYPMSVGATLAQAAALQIQVAAVGKTYGVPVAQLTVGAGWYPPLYEGHYKSFGTPPADLGNAHIYMNANSPPLISLIRIGNLAAYSVPGKPVDVTEFGTYQKLGQSDAVTSTYMHEAPFDAFALGYVGLSVYALHDDMSGVVGFYTRDGYKRDFADYWHFTTQLLADPAGRLLPPKTLNLSFSGKGSGIAPLGIKNLAMYKSDGSLWIAAYDEERSGAPDSIETIRLDRSYAVVTVIDARNGVTVAQYHNTASIALPLPCNHVYFVVAK